MTPALFLDCALLPALRLLPVAMDGHKARALVLAICLQESELRWRAQVNGPARGYAQFEIAGCAGVLSHHASKAQATRICESLDLAPAASAVHRAMEFNDLLSAAFARLLLWTVPGPLPASGDADLGWQMYELAWRPGKPRRKAWTQNYSDAWEVVSS